MKTYSKNDTQFKKFIKKVKDEFQNFFSPQMELVCEGVPIHIPVNEIENEKTKNLIFHHTGSYPKNGTIGRDIMEGKEVRILDDSEDIQYHDIDAIINPVEAQNELAKILHSRKAAHEYITYEATKMFNDSEIVRYTLHMVAGSKSEDYNFMPHEKLEHLFAEKPKKRYKDDKEFVKENDISNLDNTFLKRIFRWVSKLAEVFTSNIEHDVINRPYMSHFFDPRRKSGDRGLNVRNGEIKFKDAASRAQNLWKLSVHSYLKGAKGQAYTYLGHFIHLVADMHVPAHVHNDIHAPWPIDKKDSYEEWCGRSDYNHLRRKGDKLNISIWKASSAQKPVEGKLWNINSKENHILDFFTDIAKETQYFRTVDVQGKGRDQRKTGKLSDDECYAQAEILIPKVISNCAQVIANFKVTVENEKNKN